MSEQRPQTVSPRRPDGIPSFLRATKLIAMMAVRDIVARRKGIVMMLVLSIPALIMIVAKLEEPRAEFHDMAPSFYMIIIPLLCMFNGTSVFADEVDSRTIGYLLTRPVSRDALYLGKFLAVWVVSSTMLVYSVLAAWLPSVWRGDVSTFLRQPAFTEFLAFQGVVLFLAALYSAVFLLISLVFRRSVLIGILYILVVEIVFCMAIGPPAKITISHHAQRLLPDSYRTSERLQIEAQRRQIRWQEEIAQQRAEREGEAQADAPRVLRDPIVEDISRPFTGLGLFAALAGLMGLGMVMTRRSDFQHMDDD